MSFVRRHIHQAKAKKRKLKVKEAMKKRHKGCSMGPAREGGKKNVVTCLSEELEIRD